MSERWVPNHCPYCGDEDLRPHSAEAGSWECHSCLRAFKLTMIGQLANPVGRAPEGGPR